ncbi:MAG: hypothetical protein V4560_11040 [Bacteroidota bacterium]
MERIVLEVDESVAKAWREAPAEKKKDIANKVNIRIGKELFDYDKNSFKQYLNQLRDTMEERGLTQEALDDILKDEL